MTDEERIWEYLMKVINNSYGVAGLMGNLFAESSLNPVCKTGGDKSIKGWQYADMVDNGTISQDTFSHDGVAFGLAQWRYWSRKEQFYLFMKGCNTSISNLDTQLMFLDKEIRTYKTVWNTLLNAKTIREASDIVLERYEKPASVSEKVKEKRAQFGQEYFDKYAKKENPPKPACKMVRTLIDNLLMRSGNGKDYSSIGRIDISGSQFPWVATSENNWHAIEVKIGKAKRVVWVSGAFSKVIE